MNDMTDESRKPGDPERREFLGKVTGAVAGAGVAAACWPFVRSMYPAADILEKGTSTIKLGNIAPGEMKTVAWQGKPVFVLHRTDEQAERMMHSEGGNKDPQSDEQRVQKPDWLVVVGLCTHLGCVPVRHSDGWSCPCHGSEFDNSGRVLKGPAPTNLMVPDYRFDDDDAIVIGEV